MAEIPHPDPKQQTLSRENLPSPMGKNISFGNLDTYEVCGSDSSKEGAQVIILVYDIFGFHPHFEYIADSIANSTGFCVVIPDFFHGKPYPRNKYPPRKYDIILKCS
jgi:dienelactone hydrolase